MRVVEMRFAMVSTFGDAAMIDGLNSSCKVEIRCSRVAQRLRYKDVTPNLVMRCTATCSLPTQQQRAGPCTLVSQSRIPQGRVTSSAFQLPCEGGSSAGVKMHICPGRGAFTRWA